MVWKPEKLKVEVAKAIEKQHDEKGDKLQYKVWDTGIL
jgi:hypothetical protein